MLHKLDDPVLIVEPMVEEKNQLFFKMSSNSALVCFLLKR